jgi:hypothetical protein
MEVRQFSCTHQACCVHMPIQFSSLLADILHMYSRASGAWYQFMILTKHTAIHMYIVVL